MEGFEEEIRRISLSAASEKMEEATANSSDGRSVSSDAGSSEEVPREGPTDVSAAGCDIVLPYEPVPFVDMDRFIGKWYEIAKIPNRWQANGNLSTVIYCRNPNNGKLRIVSRTFVDGRRIEHSGRLWVNDQGKSSSYKCQFLWPFTGMFWILHLGEKENYGYCVIGDPSKTNLWILSRTPTLEDYVYEKLVAQLEWQGYNTSKLVVTSQSEDLAAYKDENDDFY
ncbi:hypothetical protein NDN08_000238 [Rhodosorus marinus]|uniref:Lipocalin/cytosolic fatty-acid binding domain-containing protein n=1 Tax=Rhodosorus marinus TaxID=101924 RepID=A0AAV8UJU8_9RHOD|nr:hypothetical protein NDN08_000238 [Rhodosorus marinus]